MIIEIKDELSTLELEVKNKYIYVYLNGRKIKHYRPKENENIRTEGIYPFLSPYLKNFNRFRTYLHIHKQGYTKSLKISLLDNIITSDNEFVLFIIKFLSNSFEYCYKHNIGLGLGPSYLIIDYIYYINDINSYEFNKSHFWVQDRFIDNIVEVHLIDEKFYTLCVEDLGDLKMKQNDKNFLIISFLKNSLYSPYDYLTFITMLLNFVPNINQRQKIFNTIYNNHFKRFQKKVYFVNI